MKHLSIALYIFLTTSFAFLATPVHAQTPTPPDLNGDGRVDFQDFTLLINGFGKPYNIFDFTKILAHFGQVQPTPTTTPVPPPPTSTDWTQLGHDAQHTGYTSEDPTPASAWTYAWHWQPTDYSTIPRGAHAVTGGGLIYMPMGTQGLVAIRQSNGTAAWTKSGTFNATAAYGPDGYLYAGSSDGKLYKISVTDGSTAASFNAASPLNHAVLLAGGFAYVTSDTGLLIKVNPATMTAAWTYTAAGNSPATTPAAYSASKDLLIFGTKDLYVHGVKNSDGTPLWRVKPTSLPAGDCYSYSYEYGWPVVADIPGIVFIRTRLGDNDNWLWGPGTSGHYPLTNADIKTYLDANPPSKDLFALDLNTGNQKFTPAAGNGGVDDSFVNNCGVGVGKTYSTIGPMPVVKTIGNSQVAYLPWRNGNVSDPSWDGRWDGHMGEMVLDNQTISGLVAGDLRFVKFNGGAIGGSKDGMIADEMTPVTMAGNTLFHAHWGASESVTITDRADNLGLTLSTPITTVQTPYVIRRLNGSGNLSVNQTNMTANGAIPLLCDGRYFTWYPADHPPSTPNSFFSFLNQVDPPATCAQVTNGYGDGMRPRYTFVSNGLILVVGNGGDIFALRH